MSNASTDSLRGDSYSLNQTLFEIKKEGRCIQTNRNNQGILSQPFLLECYFPVLANHLF